MARRGLRGNRWRKSRASHEGFPDNLAMSESPEAVVFFCHGSPDPAWREPFDAILAEFRARHPGRRAALCFLERMAPGLPETIDAVAAEGVRRIRVIPLFLAPGKHTRADLPAMLEAARRHWPGLEISAAGTLAEDPALRAAIVAAAIAGDAASRSP